jgi:hypothetical protein
MIVHNNACCTIQYCLVFSSRALSLPAVIAVYTFLCAYGDYPAHMYSTLQVSPASTPQYPYNTNPISPGPLHPTRPDLYAMRPTQNVRRAPPSSYSPDLHLPYTMNNLFNSSLAGRFTVSKQLLSIGSVRKTGALGFGWCC